MLPLDLLNELITLLDDASTYRTFSLASRITSHLCRKDEANAKKRFMMPQKDSDHAWYQLPDATLHGPNLSYLHACYVVYLSGRYEGPYWEWYTHIFKHSGSRCISAYYREGRLHGNTHGGLLTVVTPLYITSATTPRATSCNTLSQLISV